MEGLARKSETLSSEDKARIAKMNRVADAFLHALNSVPKSEQY